MVQSGAEVQVMMTPGAHEFVTPLTFATLSGRPVVSEFTESKESGAWTNHVHTALWADLLVLAPLSANTLAKMATGQSDNFFLATYMSARCSVMVAPAMDHDMFLHGGTQANLEKLKSFGHRVLEPASGELASGLIGKGRMAEPDDILSAVVDHFHPTLPLKGKKILITAGPTYEWIDPVRFIGNFSSGKMGFALAHRAAELGASVVLVSGPSHEELSHPSVEIERVTNGAEMLQACLAHYDHIDGVIFSAAVADYTPAMRATEKIKKSGESMRIDLVANVDIAAELGRRKKPGCVHVGFALETQEEATHARSKMNRKNFDMVVLNSLRDTGAGFGGDTNKITLFWPDNKTREFGLKTKQAVASDILEAMIELMP
jgi:phosphopantothenoylcysteine decarboxylase / phosphopantothenate---cysteine ligase